jgi:hypothetical protein
MQLTSGDDSFEIVAWWFAPAIELGNVAAGGLAASLAADHLLALIDGWLRHVISSEAASPSQSMYGFERRTRETQLTR